MILEKKRDQVFLFISSYSYAKFPVLYVSRQKLLSSIGTFPASCLYMINLVIIILFGLLSAHELVSSGNLLTSTNERIHKYPFGCLLWVQCQACI
jgi:hypothetical protein